ncbi:MAG TPA: biotin carboxylase, partial [Fredinandcohnia sp.]|nr:biotin carboxylase [Fredinandcohnia sp.]
AENEAELDKALRTCGDRARAAFGVEAVYLERYLDAPRHVEVQILGDSRGKRLHLFDRECSIQRRHQKVLEEAGSPLFLNGQNAELQQRMFTAALAAAKAFGYANAGTVEFLVADGDFHFIEMNARLQVEHPVTEFITGVDLIGWQLRIAAGEALDLEQGAVRRAGAAIQLRVYAEDPVRFLPRPGTIAVWEEPRIEGVRVDAGYAAGQTVTPFYDPLLAKIVVHGADRDDAIGRALEAVEAFRIEGEKLQTNLDLHRRILQSETFRAGALDTRFLERLTT